MKEFARRAKAGRDEKDVMKAEKRVQAAQLVNAGMSQRQAAKVTGVPQSTINSDLKRSEPDQKRSEPDHKKVPQPKPNLPPGKFTTIVIDPIRDSISWPFPA